MMGQAPTRRIKKVPTSGWPVGTLKLSVVPPGVRVQLRQDSGYEFQLHVIAAKSKRPLI
jgi:hypothetical protein